MKFCDFSYVLEASNTGSISVVVKAELLRLIWTGTVRTHEESRIVSANRSVLDQLAREKLHTGQTDGRILLTTDDWRG